MKNYIINPINQFEKIAKSIEDAVNDMENNNSKKICCQPKVDIFETKQDYNFSIELPGMQKENISLSVDEENVLVVKGDKKNNLNDDKRNYIRFERNYGIFERKFMLPDDADRANVKAKYENGVLNVIVAKKEPEKPEEINISIL